MIVPTVGRVVWFRPGNGSRMMMHVRDDQQPLLANIIYVWNASRVSLHVTDHEGHTHFLPTVQLLQASETPPPCSYCEWPHASKNPAADPKIDDGGFRIQG
jgi:hypothetical protein